MNYTANSAYPRLLVIDDDMTYQYQLVSILRTVGIQDITLANTAEEGISYIQDRKKNGVFDLVLLDINMPKLDGIETCLLLTETLLMENTPILMVTGSDNTIKLEDAINVGATDYITKPIRKTTLMARVDLILENQRLKRQLIEFEERYQSRGQSLHSNAN